MTRTFFISRFGDLEITYAHLLLYADKLHYLSHLIDRDHLNHKAKSPILLINPPVVQLQKGNVPFILNEAVSTKMLSKRLLHPKDQIICYQVSDDDAFQAKTYYEIVDKAIHLPSEETIIKLLNAAYDPNSRKEALVLKKILCIPPEHDITISDLVVLIKEVRKKSTLSRVKTGLSLTQSSPPASNNGSGIPVGGGV